VEHKGLGINALTDACLDEQLGGTIRFLLAIDLGAYDLATPNVEEQVQVKKRPANGTR
jgi:hypothetical protein